MPVEAQTLVKEFERLRSQSATAREVRALINKYVMPRIGVAPLTGKATEATAEWRNPDVWDFTAPSALLKLAAHVHSAVAPPGSQWFGGAFPQAELRNDKASREWAEGNATILWQALEESDFQSEIGAGLQEYLGLGNTFVVQEVLDDGVWGGLDYTAVPVDECEFRETTRGLIERWYRLLSWTPAQMVDRFGLAGVPDLIRKKAEGPEANEPENVLFVIYAREELKGKPVPLNAAPELRPWGGVYVLMEGAQVLGAQPAKEGEAKAEGQRSEIGYYNCPVYLARFNRTPGSRWAHGLGHVVLPAVRGLNALLETYLAAGALELAPPIATTDDGLLGDPDMGPNGIVNVASLDGFKVLRREGRIDVGQALVGDQRAEIRRVFHEDALDLKDSPQMTAMEAQLRYDVMLKLLGPTLARLQSEFFDQMLSAAYQALYRAGRFPPPPPLVMEKGDSIGWVYRGPTARARRMDQVAARERGASYVAALRKMGFEEVKHVFRPIQSVREVFEDLGIGSTVLASEAEVKKALDGEAELRNRMLKAEARRAEGEAVQQGADAMQSAQGVSVNQPLPASPPPILDPTIGS